MDTLSNIGLGLSVALQPNNLLFCLIGAVVGTLVGVLPGLGPLATMAMLLPLTYYAPPDGALIMLAGIYYGAQYGGSTTAILVNMPGESSSVVTCLDGHQMARQGRAGAALAIAALGSLFAGTVATFLIAFFCPPLTELALLFRPTAYFSLMVLGLVGSIVLSSGSLLKALGMIVLGILLGQVGTDPNTGAARFTMGLPELRDGIGFIPIAVGLFGLGHIIASLETPEARSVVKTVIGRLWPTRQELRQSAPAILRGTAVGSLLGILPGGGAMLSSFASYALEKRVSAQPERFGHGAIEGVAGPESANNAGSQTSFIPMLTLGVPANPVMALMIGGMMMQGIQPGPQVMAQQPTVFWGLIASMWVGNLMLVVINLPLIGIWVRLLTIPYRVLYPVIGVLCCIGAYSVSYSTFDVALCAAFGLIGYIFIKLRCEPAPLILGYVLGPLMEENFRRAMVISRGDPTVFATDPISLTLLVGASVLLASTLIPALSRKRQEAFQDAD